MKSPFFGVAAFAMDFCNPHADRGLTWEKLEGRSTTAGERGGVAVFIDRQ